MSSRCIPCNGIEAAELLDTGGQMYHTYHADGEDGGVSGPRPGEDGNGLGRCSDRSAVGSGQAISRLVVEVQPRCEAWEKVREIKTSPSPY